MKVLSVSSTPTATLPLCTVIAILALTTPVFLHMITKKYIINIDYLPKDDKYIATIYNFFGIKKNVKILNPILNLPNL
jgi:hypothetical protein